MYISEAIIILWSAVLFFIIYTDIRYRLIYNKTILLVIALVLLSAFVFDIRLNIIGFIAFSIIGFLFFTIKVIGGGDVKLIAVLSALVSPNKILLFLFLVSIFGCLVCLVFLTTRKLRKKLKEEGVPYAVGIVFGFIAISII